MRYLWELDGRSRSIAASAASIKLRQAANADSLPGPSAHAFTPACTSRSVSRRSSSAGSLVGQPSGSVSVRCVRAASRCLPGRRVRARDVRVGQDRRRHLRLGAGRPSHAGGAALASGAAGGRAGQGGQETRDDDYPRTSVDQTLLGGPEVYWAGDTLRPPAGSSPDDVLAIARGDVSLVRIDGVAAIAAHNGVAPGAVA